MSTYKKTSKAYLTHNNVIKLALLSDGVEITDYTPILRVTLAFDNSTLDSDVDAGVFDWSAGKLIIAIGETSIPIGSYYARLTVYSADSQDGIVWMDKLPVVVA